MRVKRFIVGALAFAAATVAVPLMPAAAVLGIGYLMPGKIAWSLANNAITLGAWLGIVASALVLFRFGGSPILRLCGWILVVAVMLGFSRGSFVTSQECVTQQGRFVDFQRQAREIREAEGATCG